MTNRSKMILGLASLLGVTAGATAVSGFAWFVTTKTAIVDVTNIGIYNNNPSLSVTLGETKGVLRTNDAENDFDLRAANDSSSVDQTFTADGIKTDFVLTTKPLAAPTVYIDDVEDTTLHSYDAANKTIHFDDAPASGKKIRAVYYDKAALTDVSSINGLDVYDPTWEAAYEGLRATKIPAAKAGEQYITFELEFAPATTGSLKVFLDRPTITGVTSAVPAETTRNNAAASVARVAFSVNSANVLTLSNSVGTNYDKGIKPGNVTNYPGDPDYNNGVESGAENDPEKGKNAYTTAGDYAVLATVDDCEHLYAPIDTNYSIRSTAPEATPANMYIATVTDAPVTVLVSIWLEGTSAVDGNGNYSTPIGGEINVHLPIVAFGA